LKKYISRELRDLTKIRMKKLYCPKKIQAKRLYFWKMKPRGTECFGEIVTEEITFDGVISDFESSPRDMARGLVLHVYELGGSGVSSGFRLVVRCKRSCERIRYDSAKAATRESLACISEVDFRGFPGMFVLVFWR